VPASLPIVKRYEPKLLSDIVGQQHITTVLKSWVEAFKKGTFDFPNLLFIGSAGVGKTSAAKAFAHELYGEDWKMGFHDFNASDDRGIPFIRNEITQITKSRPFEGLNIIFLDEADNLTPEAQFALRRLMEDYSHITRFILSVNYPNKIIPPVRQRCGELYFGKLKDEEMSTLLRKVVTGENLKINREAAELLIKLSYGAPRNLLNKLNLIVGLGAETITTKEVTMVLQVCPEDIAKKMWSDITNKRPVQADIDLINATKQGISVEILIDGLFDAVISENKNQEKLYPIFAEYSYRMAMGANPTIQARALIWECFHLLNGGS
jgi:replication factor C small subunit